MPNLLDSAANLRAALLGREFSARDLLTATLEAIERLNPVLNAVVHEDRALAFRSAAASDERIAQGAGRPLEGLPITIKDSFEVAGMPATAGAPALKTYVPRSDATAVARLRKAGAVIIGKTNVPLFTSDFQTFNSIYGTTHNPWNTGYSPGGSSGGSAAAVATGMSALDLGSDLAGSIRWPAHCCGIFGLKTTWALVPLYGHIPPLPETHLARNPDIVVAGPLARSAADLDLALNVLAGPRDPLAPVEALKPPRKTSAKGLRIALWCDEPFAPVDPSVTEAVNKAALMLERAGAIIDPSARPAFSFAEAWEVFAVLAHALTGAGLPGTVRERFAKSGPIFSKGDLTHRALQMRGFNLETADLLNLQARRARLIEEWARFFESTDVVLCPSAPAGPIRHDHTHDPHARSIEVNGERRPYFDLMLWACLASGGGLPAAAAPVMVGRDGLPRGVQIIAGPFEDRTAIACALMLERLGARFQSPTLSTRAKA